MWCVPSIISCAFSMYYVYRSLCDVYQSLYIVYSRCRYVHSFAMWCFPVILPCALSNLYVHNWVCDVYRALSLVHSPFRYMYRSLLDVSDPYALSILHCVMCTEHYVMYSDDYVLCIVKSLSAYVIVLYSCICMWCTYVLMLCVNTLCQ